MDILALAPNLKTYTENGMPISMFLFASVPHLRKEAGSMSVRERGGGQGGSDHFNHRTPGRTCLSSQSNTTSPLQLFFFQYFFQARSFEHVHSWHTMLVGSFLISHLSIRSSSWALAWVGVVGSARLGLGVRCRGGVAVVG
jgi:hypothetical protein